MSKEKEIVKEKIIKKKYINNNIHPCFVRIGTQQQVKVSPYQEYKTKKATPQGIYVLEAFPRDVAHAVTCGQITELIVSKPVVTESPKEIHDNDNDNGKKE